MMKAHTCAIAALLFVGQGGALAAEGMHKFTVVKVMVPDCDKRQLTTKQWIKEGYDPEGLSSRRPRDEFAAEVISDRLYRSLCAAGTKNQSKN